MTSIGQVNQRPNVEAVRAAGVHLAFWSGNEVYWKTRYEDSSSAVTTDGSPYGLPDISLLQGDARRHHNFDPFGPSNRECATWRDPRFSPSGTGGAPDAGTISPQGGAGKPEIALTGTIFTVDDFREDQILIPYPDDAAALLAQHPHRGGPEHTGKHQASS